MFRSDDGLNMGACINDASYCIEKAVSPEQQACDAEWEAQEEDFEAFLTGSENIAEWKKSHRLDDYIAIDSYGDSITMKKLWRIATHHNISLYMIKNNVCRYQSYGTGWKIVKKEV